MTHGTGHNTNDFSKGDKVYFGRGNGEQTLGEVIKVNKVNLQVRQLEARGQRKNHNAGTIWKVPPSLCRPVGGTRPIPAPTFTNPTQRRTAQAAFNVGDRVEFNAKGGVIVGTVKRVNRKTISINPDDGRPGGHWRVSPSLVRNFNSVG